MHVIHESAPSVPRELERQFQLDENCMRHLTVVADNPKYIEEMNKAKARQAEAEAAGQSESSSDDSNDDNRRASHNSERDDRPKAEETPSQSDADSGDDEQENS